MNPTERELLKANGKVLISAEGKQRLRALARLALLRTRDPHSSLDLHDMTELMIRAAEVGAAGGVLAGEVVENACVGAECEHRQRAIDHLPTVEKETILRVISQHTGRPLREVTSILGIGKTTLFNKLREYRKQEDSSESELLPKN